MYAFLTVLGIYALVCFLYENLRSPLYLLWHWRQERKGKSQSQQLMAKYGKWAAVTGSTDGIGKAYARELARLGFNIVLISRTEAKLKLVAQEIEKEFGVETFIVQCDFSKGSDVYDSLFSKLSEKPIGILVNNVGMGYDKPGTVSTFSAENVWQMINVNISAATQLSRHFIARWQKSAIKGYIVNISSGTELQPCPFGSVYAASKAYIRSFTLALQKETANLGITVQLVSPNFVVTKINAYSKRIMRGNLFIPGANEYAKWAVSTLGRVDETTGYFWHGIQNLVWKIIPSRIRTTIIVWFVRAVVDDLAEIK